MWGWLCFAFRERCGAAVARLALFELLDADEVNARTVDI
jgi:hypothetical protein